MRTVLEILIKFISKLLLKLPFVSERAKNKDVQKTINLYSDQGFTKYFSAIRFWDAPLIDLNKKIPREGLIVDLGCGEGILTNYLAVSSSKRELLGLEINPNRVKLANKKLKNTKFKEANILKEKFPRADVFIINNVLHHLPSYSDQVVVLEKCFMNLKKDGQLIISEVDRSFRPKYFLAWIVDAYVVPILFEKKLKDTFYHRPRNEWKNILEDIGFLVKLYPMKHGPFPDVIIVAKKKHNAHK